MKKALLVGINYVNTQNELRGCANDCKNIETFLKQKFGFSDITFLTDAIEYPGYESPTLENIKKHIALLIKDAKKDDHIYFHYSGHGSYVKDTNNDEIDKRDEVIVPVDFQTNGFLLDDELFNILVKPLPAGVQLITLSDSCHSGTILDLKYSNTVTTIYDMKSRKYKKSISRIISGKYACDCDSLCISGCLDNQTSADAYLNGQFAGAMTTAFISSYDDYFKKYKKMPSYKDLLIEMHGYLEKNQFTQKPMINCSNNTTLNKVINL